MTKNSNKFEGTVVALIYVPEANERADAEAATLSSAAAAAAAAASASASASASAAAADLRLLPFFGLAAAGCVVNGPDGSRIVKNRASRQCFRIGSDANQNHRLKPDSKNDS
jgi:hypothetical protein